MIAKIVTAVITSSTSLPSINFLKIVLILLTYSGSIVLIGFYIIAGLPPSVSLTFTLL